MILFFKGPVKELTIRNEKYYEKLQETNLLTKVCLYTIYDQPTLYSVHCTPCCTDDQERLLSTAF